MTINAIVTKNKKMKTIQKIGLLSIPYKNTTRTEYIKALEANIMNLPITKTTKDILSLKLPVDIGTIDNPKRTKEETFLFLILDRGIIMHNYKKPGAWTNNFTISESSGEMKIFKKNKITADMIKEAFSEVNGFLDGFSFIIEKCRYEIGVKEKFWFICYNSNSFNKFQKKQIEKLMKPTKK